MRADAIAMAYRRQRRRRHWVLAALAGTVLLALLADLLTGPSGLGAQRVLSGLFEPAQLTAAERVILWEVRLPTALLALLVGIALAIAGAEMQVILGNPLAEPFTLGISSSAALGASLVIVLDIALPGLPSFWLVSANAFVFALGSMLLIQLLIKIRGAEAQTLVLFGIAIGFTAGALLSLVQFVASEDALQQLVFWSMGSLARADWAGVAGLALIVLLIGGASLRSAADLTALRLGDERARGFGVDVARLRFWALIRVSLLAASAVALVGTIGFVGLVGPHVARLLVGEDQRLALPASLLTGAAMMVAASVISKTLSPGELLPVGVMTALIGLPWFIALVLRRPAGR